jgi:hypothetical protein
MTEYKLPPSPDLSSGNWEQVPREELPQDEAGGLVGWTFAGREHDEMLFPHVIMATDALGRKYAYVSVDLKQEVWRWKAGGSTIP